MPAINKALETSNPMTSSNLVSCEQLHETFNQLPLHRFPFDSEAIPPNGIYILFQKGEEAHGTNRIVRIGTHTGENQLRPRLKQHFLSRRKDRSIFRKNIGRCLLNKAQDPFLEAWNLDLTSRENREAYTGKVDFRKQEEIERQVEEFIQGQFFFAALQIPEKTDRIEIESRLISTVSLCEKCRPSKSWMGLNSPKKKIRESGLWQEQELYKTPISNQEWDSIHDLG